MIVFTFIIKALLSQMIKIGVVYLYHGYALNFSEISGNAVKDEATVSITPPASEAGNDEDLLVPGYETSKPLQKSAESSKARMPEKKRRHRHSEGPQSPKNVKRPRRSLIEDYLTIVDKAENQKQNGSVVSQEEDEAEYEVETIVNFKRSEVRLYRGFF